MRAGPLSSPEVIKILNEQFVNVWVLQRDIQEIAEGAKFKNLNTLARTFQQYDTTSVNILILTQELEVVMHLPEDTLPRQNRTQEYLAFLQQFLEG